MKARKLSTFFLFAKHLDADGCLCLRLNAAGEEEASLLKRSATEIVALQEDARTIVVLPSSSASLHTLTLPWLGERKAREAIPFALEEMIAQPLTEVHFAFDKAHYNHGQYLVVAIDNQLLSQCIGLLNELNIDFDILTLDWFALKPREVFVAEDRVLVAMDAFKGALSPDLAQIYLSEMSEVFHGFLFADSAIEVHSSQFVSTQGTFDSFVAKRLASGSFMNLCQGDFRHNTHQETSARWYYASAALLGVWLLSILGTNGLILHKLKFEDAGIQRQIASVYHVFFPHATEVISPRFRIEQALKDEATGKKGDVWYVLGPLVKAVDDTDGLKVEQWFYQNKIISVHLSAKNFAVLETFEKHLEKMNIKVKQRSAGTAEKAQITAVLELEA